MRHPVPLSDKMQEFEKICRRQGLPLTVQRRAVLDELVRRQDHPTADQVFKDIAASLPGVSRTTVYRVLETLVRIGIARKVCHPGAAARFEVATHRHHHLVCLECGRMTDLEDPNLDGLPLPDTETHGYELTDYTIQFRGTCTDCTRAAARRGAPARRRRVKKKSSRRAAQQDAGGPARGRLRSEPGPATGPKSD